MLPLSPGSCEVHPHQLNFYMYSMCQRPCRHIPGNKYTSLIQVIFLLDSSLIWTNKQWRSVLGLYTPCNKYNIFPFSLLRMLALHGRSWKFCFFFLEILFRSYFSFLSSGGPSPALTRNVAVPLHLVRIFMKTTSKLTIQDNSRGISLLTMELESFIFCNLQFFSTINNPIACMHNLVPRFGITSSLNTAQYRTFNPFRSISMNSVIFQTLSTINKSAVASLHLFWSFPIHCQCIHTKWIFPLGVSQIGSLANRPINIAFIHHMLFSSFIRQLKQLIACALSLLPPPSFIVYFRYSLIASWYSKRFAMAYSNIAFMLFGEVYIVFTFNWLLKHFAFGEIKVLYLNGVMAHPSLVVLFSYPFL